MSVQIDTMVRRKRRSKAKSDWFKKLLANKAKGLPPPKYIRKRHKKYGKKFPKKPVWGG